MHRHHEEQVNLIVACGHVRSLDAGQTFQSSVDCSYGVAIYAGVAAHIQGGPWSIAILIYACMQGCKYCHTTYIQ